MREKETWKELAENLYFKQAQSMTQIAEFLTDIPYRTIQKHIQRHPNYRTRNNRNIQNALDSLEYTVKKQTETMNRLKESDRCPQPEQDVYEWVKLGDYQQLQDTKTWDSSPYLMDRVTKPIVPFEPLHTPRIVGTIGDTHFPFEHQGYLPFLQDTFEKWGVTDIVHLGDLSDNHAISRHQTDTVANGATTEFTMAHSSAAKYFAAFPEALMVLGNHDDIPKRQAATLGMPESFLKTFADTWGLPSRWVVDNHFIIDNVLYCHGLGSSGDNGAINKALNERMSVVQGHQHSCFSIIYKANQKDIIFGAYGGCGVDNNAYAFNYGKYAIKKPIMGTVIVNSSSEAHLVPMNEKYFKGGQK